MTTRPNTLTPRSMFYWKPLILGLGLSGSILLSQAAQACSRVVYLGEGETVVTGRTMDWVTDLGSNLWIFPQGIKRNGAAGANSMEWTSKYGSVVTSAFEAASADGINEKGLVANLLYLAESQYPDLKKEEEKPRVCISAWAQYVLDQFGTVKEAVAALKEEPFLVTTVTTPDGKPGTVHLAISDASGDSAILEYINGELVIHHGREYQVMTNSPIYSEQISLNEYWKQIGGLTMLPGTNRAADRFVRASFYVGAVSQTAQGNEAVASTFSIMRNVSVPLGISTPGAPNIASTLWRTVADQKDGRYFYESTRSPNIFWVDLKEINFSPDQPVRKLTLTGQEIYAGNALKDFKQAEPFQFLTSTTP